MNQKFFNNIFFFLVIILQPTISYAGYQTGQEFLIACTGAYEDQDKSVVAPIHCLGYLDGIIDAYAILSSIHTEIKDFCAPPEGISAGDALDIVILFIQKNPETRSIPARTVIIKALSSKYPCSI